MTVVHLADAALVAIAEGAVSVEELSDASRHLHGCAACATRLVAVVDGLVPGDMTVFSGPEPQEYVP